VRSLARSERISLLKIRSLSGERLNRVTSISGDDGLLLVGGPVLSGLVT